MPEDENREVTVRAPSKPVAAPEKQAEKKTEKALEEERYGVLQFPKKISRILGVVVLATGVLLLGLYAYMSATGETGGILLASGSGSASLVVWSVVGLLNIVAGFAFLGRD
jgi:hypothetical protein